MPSLNLLSEPKSTTSAGKAIPRSNNSFSKKVFPQTMTGGLESDYRDPVKFSQVQLGTWLYLRTCSNSIKLAKIAKIVVQILRFSTIYRAGIFVLIG